MRKYKVFQHGGFPSEDLENLLNDYYDNGYDIYRILNKRDSYGGTQYFIYIMKKGQNSD